MSTTDGCSMAASLAASSARRATPHTHRSSWLSRALTIAPASSGWSWTTRTRTRSGTFSKLAGSFAVGRELGRAGDLNHKGAHDRRQSSWVDDPDHSGGRFHDSVEAQVSQRSAHHLARGADRIGEVSLRGSDLEPADHQLRVGCPIEEVVSHPLPDVAERPDGDQSIGVSNPHGQMSSNGGGDIEDR